MVFWHFLLCSLHPVFSSLSTALCPLHLFFPSFQRRTRSTARTLSATLTSGIKEKEQPHLVGLLPSLPSLPRTERCSWRGREGGGFVGASSSRLGAKLFAPLDGCGSLDRLNLCRKKSCILLPQVSLLGRTKKNLLLHFVLGAATTTPGPYHRGRPIYRWRRRKRTKKRGPVGFFRSPGGFVTSELREACCDGTGR